ncbi:MAG TPA: TRAP transporter large permease [Rhodocyclaceae bacterium]|jgi:C4-dicarboxylate transporter, DctM subunit|nr:TRAP transporter large permease [Rhodocyclaceae bacterium]HRQ46487.1 TRAP transporter large permease [Rhodocyclaceae bacterium]
MTEALIGFAAMLALALARMPIAFAMGLVGVVGFAWKVSWPAAFALAGSVTYETGLSYGLSIIPLFILMGNLVTRAGLSEELYTASYAFLGHRRGGLAMSTVVACGGFSAICGSSIATAATMAKVAIPPMRRFGYSDSLASGSVAAGGTLGILIPPSIILVIYGILTGQNIGKLFIAGILPGMLAILCYLGAVSATVYFDPKSGPPGERMAWPGRLRALRNVWGVLVLFVLVLGGIYGGVFTPTEAAGIGAGGAFVFAVMRKGWSWRLYREILVDSATTTAMIFSILIGALLFANFVNMTTMPTELIEFTDRFAATPLLVIVAICLIYVLLGCVLESMSMMLLTVPLFYPVVAHLGFDLIWFGIIVVVAIEISLITPPVGLNVFVLRSVLPDISTRTIFRGVLPFVAADVIRLSILVLFPVITLYLTQFVR